ncbi:MAG: hypothetical protein GX233_01135 [Erysipelothrix sp.]|nr:hypothetical protein [Erysipelothrix sp.]
MRAILLDRKVDVVGVDQHNLYYSLRKNGTDYQKAIYTQLSDAFDQEVINEEAISGLVVQNFVADFYTWTNKLRFNDVGGLQFLHNDVEGWVNAQALETFYNDMNYYLQNGGLEDTLEVSRVDVSAVKSEFEMGEDDEITKVPSYVVNASWSYLPSSKISVDEFQSSAVFTLIADDEGLFTIVEVSDIEEE